MTKEHLPLLQRLREVIHDPPVKVGEALEEATECCIASLAEIEQLKRQVSEMTGSLQTIEDCAREAMDLQPNRSSEPDAGHCPIHKSLLPCIFCAPNDAERDKILWPSVAVKSGEQA